MKKLSRVNLPNEKTASFESASDVQVFLYYLSFILAFGTLAYIALILMIGYPDQTGILLTEKNGIIIFYILQFPLGLLYGLFTEDYNSAIFPMLLNPIFIGWTLQKFIFKEGGINIKRTSQINFLLWTIFVIILIAIS